MMVPVIFWGATGQARVLREALDERETKLLALFDNRDIPSPFDDIPIFHGESGFDRWERTHRNERSVSACVSIGGACGKHRLERLQWLDDRGYPPLTVTHARAFVAPDAILGAGCQVMALGAVCTGVKLGRAVIINTKASIDHDCTIEDGVHVAPGATLAGEIVVGTCAFIGTGAIILPRIRVGAHAIVGAGAVVTHDVSSGTVVTGNPAHLHNKGSK